MGNNRFSSSGGPAITSNKCRCNKQRVRILVINNPLTALFMKARLDEIESEKNCIYTIVLYEKREMPLGYGSNLDKDEEENKSRSLLLVKDKYPIYEPPSIYYRYPTFLTMMVDAVKIRKEQCNNKIRLDSFLRSVRLIDANVTEIWHANTHWQKYLSLFYPSAETFRFDHGLSETLIYFSSDTEKLIKLIWSKLRLRFIISYFFGLYFIIRPVETVSDHHYTLNALQINAALGRKRAEMIDPGWVRGEVISVKRAKGLCQGSTMAIILLENIKPWAKSDLDHKEYFAHFESMLLACAAPRLEALGLNTLVFKPKHWHEEYAREAVKSFDRLSRKFQLKYFPDYYANLPIEYFLKELVPKVLIGNLSSALYYAKQLVGGVETYTYDEWFVGYSLDKFGATYPDLERSRKVMFGRKVKYFEGLNPISL